MANATPPVFQIVGYKNRGKTTLLSEMIAYGSSRGDKIAAIKHHGHEEPLKSMHKDTDSYRLLESGAVATGVDSPRLFQLEYNHQEEFPFQKLLDIYSMFQPELILVEGYKREPYPKAVIIKRSQDLALLNLPNIQFVITWDPELTEGLSFPVIPIDAWRKHLPKVYKVAKGGE